MNPLTKLFDYWGSWSAPESNLVTQSVTVGSPPFVADDTKLANDTDVMFFVFVTDFIADFGGTFNSNSSYDDNNRS